MERYTVFATKNLVKAPVSLQTKIKDWLIENEVIKADCSEFGFYDEGKNYNKITSEDWGGSVQFITEQTELINFLGAEFFTFFYPEIVICPKCKTSLIQTIDAATFYGEANKYQDPKELVLLEDIWKGLNEWREGRIVDITCISCSLKNPINMYEYKEGLIFTNCAIVFWNWPELNQEFKDFMCDKLGPQVHIIEEF